ncbi:MAG TPA: hypothetical protein PK616_04965, partial [Fibrobacteraceae bacterium]|nr:hypothetical protein [Fibrobacteraceae bacterium]
MKKLFKIISFVIIFFILSYGASFVASVSSQSFFEDFTEENLSQEWNFVHVAAGGDISSSEGILNIKASPLFQDSPNSAMVMRHWLSQNDNFLNISVRLKINSFDRFAIQVDHKKPLSYSDLSPMFGLVFRAAGTPTSNYILAVGNQNGEWKGGSGIEGSLISNLKVNEWYQSEIFIQESPYTVVFTLMDNQRNVLIQKTIDANSLTNYNFEEIGSVGFSAWTSLKDGPYGNTDIDWLEVTTESSVEPENDVTFFDDFDGTQLSSDWQVEDRGHNFALNNGSLTLYSDVSSGTTSVAIYREYIPKTDEFTVRARVSSDKLAGFALRLHSG